MLRSWVSLPIRSRAMLKKINFPNIVQKRLDHHEGPPQPFDNMPFKIHNRYMTTAFFAIFFGIGLWAPFLIVWYSMAKRTM